MSRFQLVAERAEPVVMNDEKRIHTDKTAPFYRKLRSLNWQSTDCLDSYADRIHAFDCLAEHQLFLQKWELAKARYSPDSPFFSWPSDLLSNIASHVKKPTHKTHQSACELKRKIFNVSSGFKYRSDWTCTSLNDIRKSFRDATVHGAKDRKEKICQLRPFLLAIDWRLEPK